MVFGKELTEQDYALLAARWITKPMALAAGLRRLDTFDGRDIVGRKKGDYSGIGIPYFSPGGSVASTYRIRRDHPEIDQQTGKEINKYCSAPGDRPHVYHSPLITPENLQDTSLPIVIVEGEFKTLALRRAAQHNRSTLLFVPIGLAGVYNWRGTVGQAENSTGRRVPVKGVIPDMEAIAWQGRKVVIAFDADTPVKPAVRIARYQLSRELRARGALVGYLEWDITHGKGPDDWLAQDGPEPFLKAFEAIDFNRETGWRAHLLCSESGKPKALAENVAVALEHAPEFEGLTLDVFSGRIHVPPDVPWREPSKEPRVWEDVDTINLARWCQRQGIEVGKDPCIDAVHSVAARNSFHPVRDYFDSLQSDGEPRLDCWLTTYAGGQPGNYTSAVGTCFMISAVARIFQPGCKADCALMLIGPQGSYKSTLCRILGGTWFSDNLPDLSSGKEAQAHLRGKMLLEIPEMHAFNKAHQNSIKAWMSRSEDIYRKVYGREEHCYPRQCVFIVTTNEAEPFKDSTGNRRFWSIVVGLVDIPALIRDRDQLWAEAIVKYREGQSWHLPIGSISDEAQAVQADRINAHPWQSAIEAYCAANPMVTVDQILTKALNKPLAMLTHSDKLNVVDCLQLMGWRRLSQRRIGGKRERPYVAPDWIGEEWKWLTNRKH